MYFAIITFFHILQFLFFINVYMVVCGPVLLSRYSNWLRAGRSGDRIPVEARYSAPVHTGPEAHQASVTMGTGSFPGIESGRGVTLTPHPLLMPRSKNRVRLYLYCP
jgi:hypothetical protein